jgi:uncharacterized protein YbjT (DUF2867 family)
MKIIIFGATGMVGQGVLRQCLRDPAVELVVTVGRSPAGEMNAKLLRELGADPSRLREIVHRDLDDLSPIQAELAGFDACFFTLGVSSAGMSESGYDRVTYGLTLAAAEPLSRLKPGMTFIYVSGAGTDSSEKGRVMWARVKGRTENALLRLPLSAYMFRPGIIQPLDGIRSKTPAYRIGYALMKPLMPLLRWALPNQVLTTREIGQAMLAVAKRGYAKQILEAKDIRAAIDA